MQPVSGHTRNDILSIVVSTVATVSPDAGTVDADTYLLGSHAILDSVGFVTLLVSLEQNVDSTVDLAASFLEHESAEDTNNPFRTVGSLANHIYRLLTEPT